MLCFVLTRHIHTRVVMLSFCWTDKGFHFFVVLATIVNCIMCAGFSIGSAILAATGSPLRSGIGYVRPLFNRRISTMQAADEPQKVAIVGGGLAGLSVAHHTLNKSPSVEITIFDRAPVGTGGASSVAGGLLHPFSPRGKLVHMGLEGLSAANRLIDEATVYKPDCILRQALFRLAMEEKHVEQLQKTAHDYPSIAKWMSPTEIKDLCNSPNSLGGLKLSGQCKVLHVPSYLKGLWLSCVEKSNGMAQWLIVEEQVDWKDRLQDFNHQIFCGGAGMLQSSGIFHQNSLPVQLVRGQSIEMSFSQHRQEAVLCGKYVSPMPDEQRVLVGATHEFGSKTLEPEEVIDELRRRCFELCPQMWEEGSVERITAGTRVQSNRGAYGRMPIVGRAPLDGFSNAWIFSGLSSRGLLHHGIYGDIITDAILVNSEDHMLAKYSHLDWWRKKNC